MNEDLVTKLAEARGELYEYDYMVETCMINGPEFVVDEMVSEIKRLRKAIVEINDNPFHGARTRRIAREALNNGEALHGNSRR